MLLGKDSDNRFVFLVVVEPLHFSLLIFVVIGCFCYSRQGSSVLEF